MERFKLLNNIGGLLALIFATIVYSLTMESSASLWDCGEFIASCHKQLVVHPPGAALFLMIGRMFTLFAPSPDKIALTINFMSALSSGLAMMFLFWITTYLARKIVSAQGKSIEEGATMWIVLASGAIAAATGTFCDTIWFSAVEGEVYSMSLMFTALVFWLMCKWEQHADEPYADRFLLLIAFLMGCSIFVHWLNLLTMPALALMYYFHRTPNPNNTGAIISLLIGFALVLFFMEVVITGVVDLMAGAEMFFVNSLGLPFNSGAVFFIVALIALIAGGLYYTYKQGKVIAHHAILAFMFILIGYSTVAQVLIRSNAQPSIDMNSPRDPVSLAAYLHREQYGSRPLFSGYFYDAEPTGVEYTGVRWQKGDKKYVEAGKKFEYEYQGAKKKLFPRIYDNKSAGLYESWLGLRKGEKPSYGDNIRFFFIYQINYMYLRYFLWNFVGRQNDEQGVGLGADGMRDGNWQGGIPVLDNMLNGQLQPQKNLPDSAKNHPARNLFYYIPLLLGVLGMSFQWVADRRRWSIIMVLFLMTGVIFILYGNAPPLEPRERDYIYAGSFFTFSIWVGLGCFAIYDFIKKYTGGAAAVGVAFVLSAIAPFLMGTQGWNDHNRHDRYAARDLAANYLNSCAPNAIIFTQGDNDTYPLWYAQEVEGIRTDVRVVNLSLLGVDWYINQIRRQLNDAAPVKMSLTPDKIAGSRRDMVVYFENQQVAPSDRYIDLKQIISFIGDDRTAKPTASGSMMSYYPTKKVSIPVDKAKIIANGTVAAKDTALVVPVLQVDLKPNSLLKNNLAVLDIIASNQWERPIYFAISCEKDELLGFEKYFQLEGLAYRLVPIESNTPQPPFLGRVNTDIMSDNLLNKFKFGNLDKPHVYANSDLRRMMYNLRSNYVRLADSYLAENNPQKAVEVLDYARQYINENAVPYNVYAYNMARTYYDAKAYDKGNEVVDKITDAIVQDLQYYRSLSAKEMRPFERDKEMGEQFIQQFIHSARQAQQEDFAKKLEQKLSLSSR